MEVLLKALLIPIAILAASLAARRFGHGVAGALAGFPMVAAPVMFVLILQHGAGRIDAIAAIAAATLASLPASLAFIVVFARLSRRAPWWRCLAGATAAFLAAASLIAFSAPWVGASAGTRVVFQVLLPLASPLIALVLMPTSTVALPTGAAKVPSGEIVVRMLVGFAMGVLLIAGAGQVSPVISGLLLTWPVTGSVLPSFTVALHGHAATAVLLRGFASGLIAFAVFFFVLGEALGQGAAPLVSFGVAIGVSMGIAGLLHRLRRVRPLRGAAS